MTEVCNQKREGIQGGQMHYREPPAAQIADTEARGIPNEQRMSSKLSTCMHVVGGWRSQVLHSRYIIFFLYKMFMRLT